MWYKWICKVNIKFVLICLLMVNERFIFLIDINIFMLKLDIVL